MKLINHPLTLNWLCKFKLSLNEYLSFIILNSSGNNLKSSLNKTNLEILNNKNDMKRINNKIIEYLDTNTLFDTLVLLLLSLSPVTKTNNNRKLKKIFDVLFSYTDLIYIISNSTSNNIKHRIYRLIDKKLNELIYCYRLSCFISNSCNKNENGDNINGLIYLPVGIVVEDINNRVVITDNFLDIVNNNKEGNQQTSREIRKSSNYTDNNNKTQLPIHAPASLLSHESSDRCDLVVKSSSGRDRVRITTSPQLSSDKSSYSLPSDTTDAGRIIDTSFRAVGLGACLNPFIISNIKTDAIKLIKNELTRMLLLWYTDVECDNTKILRDTSTIKNTNIDKVESEKKLEVSSSGNKINENLSPLKLKTVKTSATAGKHKVNNSMKLRKNKFKNLKLNTLTNLNFQRISASASDLAMAHPIDEREPPVIKVSEESPSHKSDSTYILHNNNEEGHAITLDFKNENLFPLPIRRNSFHSKQTHILCNKLDQTPVRNSPSTQGRTAGLFAPFTLNPSTTHIYSPTHNYKTNMFLRKPASLFNPVPVSFICFSGATKYTYRRIIQVTDINTDTHINELSLYNTDNSIIDVRLPLPDTIITNYDEISDFIIDNIEGEDLSETISDNMSYAEDYTDEGDSEFIVKEDNIENNKQNKRTTPTLESFTSNNLLVTFYDDTNSNNKDNISLFRQKTITNELKLILEDIHKKTNTPDEKNKNKKTKRTYKIKELSNTKQVKKNIKVDKQKKADNIKNENNINAELRSLSIKYNTCIDVISKYYKKII
ncbi:hypothetical protein CDIK_1369 [Cucumispora dikerogammari]|nr:hypothetical protein CDIK_1369 [Cucumispora dikerogammari]